ncbi:MAG: 1-acyl-sn-glycerol-3-phosphate acyltransferase [Clostridia bacterium]|nr:1-acyl-sn-glycerol-3-phosphate acyltransferase [Clostridia bacterium]
MAKKTIYYEDALHDDFARDNITAKTVPDDFSFAPRNPFWRILEFILYRVIATPLVWLMTRIGFGLKIKNRKALKKIRKSGYFLYGNHTHGMLDAYDPTLIAFPKRAHIVTGPEAVSVPVLRRIVQLLGGIPLPGSLTGYRSFYDALHYRIGQKRVITIYPEAHIWPWYTGIRPFPDGSFSYPVRENVPVVAFVTTFRRRRIFKNLWPCATVTLSDPFYPDTLLSPREAKKDLRDRVYAFMCETIESTPDNYVYYEYVKRPAPDGKADEKPKDANE